MIRCKMKVWVRIYACALLVFDACIRTESQGTPTVQGRPEWGPPPLTQRYLQPWDHYQMFMRAPRPAWPTSSVAVPWGQAPWWEQQQQQPATPKSPIRITEQLVEYCHRRPNDNACRGIPRIDCNAWLPEGDVKVARIVKRDEIKTIETLHPYASEHDINWIIYTVCGQFRVVSIELSPPIDGVCKADYVQVSLYGDVGKMEPAMCGSVPDRSQDRKTSIENSLFIKFKASTNTLMPRLGGFILQVRVASDSPWPRY
ncbi:uncharacterized protein LOC141904659 isoform X2 [Tubulanus polymorphus]|uniref:uncharacterized protein LOC141904659 isoform X2 n=1 Tax=Tubulanus polymorphus TaxID=672921 RepID=UPI003DA2F3D7